MTERNPEERLAELRLRMARDRNRETDLQREIEQAPQITAVPGLILSYMDSLFLTVLTSTNRVTVVRLTGATAHRGVYTLPGNQNWVWTRGYKLINEPHIPFQLVGKAEDILKVHMP